MLNLLEASKAGVPDVVSDLFPNLPNFIAHVLATCIIIIFISKMVYKPFRKMIEQRRNKINELLDDATFKQTQAIADRRTAKEILNEAKKESQSIISQARSDADKTKMSIIEDARVEASNIQKHAKNAIVRERLEAQSQIKNDVINLAFAAAEKLLESNVSSQKNEQLVKEFLEDLDSNK